jgi:hypothetical protein
MVVCGGGDDDVEGADGGGGDGFAMRAFESCRVFLGPRGASLRLLGVDDARGGKPKLQRWSEKRIFATFTTCHHQQDVRSRCRISADSENLLLSASHSVM